MFPYTHQNCYKHTLFNKLLIDKFPQCMCIIWCQCVLSLNTESALSHLRDNTINIDIWLTVSNGDSLDMKYICSKSLFWFGYASVSCLVYRIRVSVIARRRYLIIVINGLHAGTCRPSLHWQSGTFIISRVPLLKHVKTEMAYRLGCPTCFCKQTINNSLPGCHFIYHLSPGAFVA